MNWGVGMKRKESLRKPCSHMYLGDIYMEQKDYPMALVYYKKALADPHLPDTERIRKAISSVEKSQKQRKGKES
jgi:cytochrome c-type biogenesis protein CcmH/NrfG